MSIIKEIFKDTDMGINAINSIRSYVENEELMHRVLCQREDLKKIREQAESMLTDNDAKECQTGRLRQAMVKTNAFVTMMFDKSSDHIAKMLIEGTNMGIDSLQSEINALEKDGENAPQLAFDLMDTYQKNLSELRSFL